MDELSKHQLSTKISESFSPGAPIDKYRLFAGRTAQARDVLTAMRQRGQHVIVYGERGVGKTSLVNVLSELIAEAGLDMVSAGAVNCDTADNFRSLWKKVFRQVNLTAREKTIGLVPHEVEERIRVDTILPDDPSPDDIRYILQNLLTPSFFILDELDRLTDPATTAMLADTVKTLSDHSVPATIILVGVADAVDELIAQHASIERSLVQVQMPRMSRPELEEILSKGLDAAGMTIDPVAQEAIVSLSQGLPHYTHLLGLHAAHAAVKQDRITVTQSDVDEAARIAVAKAQQTIRTAYHRATSSARKTLYPQVLLACALAHPDQLGFFAAADVRAPMRAIMGKAYDIPAFSAHLNGFCDPKRGPVLQKTGTSRRFRFRFINPLMQPYVILDGLARGLISWDLLHRL